MAAQRELLGKRLKKVRESKGLTLKALEASAGISATHVSEIERGKTSPTIGALTRIARALGKDPTFFLEQEELGDVSLVTVDDRVRVALADGLTTSQSLTTTVAGGRLQVARITLPSGAHRHESPHAHEGNEAIMILQGCVRLSVDGEAIDLARGDSVHFDASLAHNYENPFAEEAVLIWVGSERDLS